MSDTPSNEDLAMAQAGQTAEALADLNRPSAEEQRAADEESAELLGEGAAAADEAGVKLTDIYSRVNTAHGAGAGAVLVQNPYTFSDDIARGNLPPTATDPHPDAQPTEPEGGGEPEPTPQAEEGEEGETKPAPVYPNLAHPLGTPEDLLYRETGVISTTVSNVDGVSIIEVDPNADEVEAPIAGDMNPQTPPPDDKLTSDDTLTEGAPEVEHTGVAGAVEDEVDDDDEVEQVESDYDPSAHTVAEVNDYISEHPEEADAIYAAEEAGKNRAGIIG
jgi:hypothetical protein